MAIATSAARAPLAALAGLIASRGYKVIAPAPLQARSAIWSRRGALPSLEADANAKSSLGKQCLQVGRKVVDARNMAVRQPHVQLCLGRHVRTLRRPGSGPSIEITATGGSVNPAGPQRPSRARGARR